MTRPLGLLTAMLVICAPCAYADSTSLTGVITAGPRSEPIANAHVTLHGGDRPIVTKTDGHGAYQFTTMVPGVRYEMIVDADGLRTVTRPDVIVGDGEKLRLDVHLELADVRYSVAVSGSTETAGLAPEIGRAVAERDVEELPSVTRSTTKYALLDPHVRQAIGLGADFQDSARLSINAASYRHTAYMLDGVSTYDWIYANSPQVGVPPSAVRELTLVAGPSSAQYGLSTTGIISVATASGGESHHGNGFVFFRPSGLQARPPLATMEVPNRRVDGGVEAGGPLKAGRTYFFGTYERAEQSRGAYIQSPVAGFFTGETREQYGLFRIDHTVSPSHALTLRLNANEYTTSNANDRVSGFNQPSFGRESHAQSIGGQLSGRSTIGSHVNELRLSVSTYTPDSATPLESSVQIVRPNYSAVGFSTANWVHARTLQGADVFTMQRGRHTVKAGGEIVRVDARDYSFTPFGTYTFAPGPPRPDDHPLTFSQTFGALDLSYGQTQASAFVQDDVRFSNRVSANFGLRYEVQSITDDRMNFGPRLAVAWDLAGDGRTVVRSGAGVYFDQYYMYLTRRFTSLGPHSPQATYTWSWGDPGFPVFPNSFTTVPQGVASGARDIVIPGDRLGNPRALQLSAGVEREIGPRLTLHLNALQSHTVRQMRVDDVNHPAPFERTAPNQVRTPQQANLSRPYTIYDGVLVRDIAQIVNTAESTYRSLDVGFTGRFGDRARIGVRYVWSSSIAYSMFYADVNSGVPNEWWPNWDQFERGPSDFHQPHRMVADGSAFFPFQTQVSVVATIASGLPVNPITGRDNNGDSYTVDRPVGFDRNSFRGSPQINFDLAGAKRFRLTTALSAEARVEIFNLFDRWNFIRLNNLYGEGPAPLPTFLAPVAGVTNADPARQIQFSVKLMF